MWIYFVVIRTPTTANFIDLSVLCFIIFTRVVCVNSKHPPSPSSFRKWPHPFPKGMAGNEFGSRKRALGARASIFWPNPLAKLLEMSCRHVFWFLCFDFFFRSFWRLMFYSLFFAVSMIFIMEYTLPSCKASLPRSSCGNHGNLKRGRQKSVWIVAGSMKSNFWDLVQESNSSIGILKRTKMNRTVL